MKHLINQDKIQNFPSTFVVLSSCSSSITSHLILRQPLIRFLLPQICLDVLKLYGFKSIYRLLFLSMLLLLLSHFSRVQRCATPQTEAHLAPPSLGFCRHEHWSGLSFPSPMHESEVVQSCPTLRDPMDCSLPGPSAHGIFQARVLEWVAIAFSFTKYTYNYFDSSMFQYLLFISFYC